MKSGYDLSKIEIVGFSLGAQIGALTSRSIPNFSKLTGLDPGQVPKVPFMDFSIEKVINSNDANFVVTIHTEKRSFGDENSVGHANFWFNGAERQPMCIRFLIGENIFYSTISFYTIYLVSLQRTGYAATLLPLNFGLKPLHPTLLLFFLHENVATTRSSHQKLVITTCPLDTLI